MTLIATSIVGFLTLLLPGVVAATILYTIMPPTKRTPITRVFHALTFTALIQTIAAAIQYTPINGNLHWLWLQPSSDLPLPPIAIILAIILPIIVAASQNHDLIHKILRKAKITRETANPAWDSAFRTNENSYVVLHLKDRRRLFGWPYDWPSNAKSGHFKIIEAQWLSDIAWDANATDTSANDEHLIDAILISAADVAFVEFKQAHQSKPSSVKGEDPNA